MQNQVHLLRFADSKKKKKSLPQSNITHPVIILGLVPSQYLAQLDCIMHCSFAKLTEPKANIIF